MRSDGRLSRRLLRVWQRNWVVYRRTWKIGFLPPLLEPFLYLVAFGLGLAKLVGSVEFDGVRVSYLQFIAPGLVAVSVMNAAFFENTYASYVRMHYQKTFSAMLATPLSIEEIIVAEIVWGATKAVISGGAMLVVLALFGLVQLPWALLVLPLALLGGLAFGSVGMFFTGIVPNIEVFNLPTFLFITPMFLFSATFFPLQLLPPPAQKLALALPLTHLARAARGLCLGAPDGRVATSVAYLAVFAGVFAPLAVHRMRRRLVK